MAQDTIDPVCGMQVDASEAISREHAGQTYYFCESACAEIFMDEPERWVERDSGPHETEKTAALHTA